MSENERFISIIKNGNADIEIRDRGIVITCDQMTISKILELPNFVSIINYSREEAEKGLYDLEIGRYINIIIVVKENKQSENLANYKRMREEAERITNLEIEIEATQHMIKTIKIVGYLILVLAIINIICR